MIHNWDAWTCTKLSSGIQLKTVSNPNLGSLVESFKLE